MRSFDIPLKEHAWAHKWCVDMNNIVSSKIPMVVVHLKLMKYKAPDNPWQPSMWMGFSQSIVDEMCYYIKTEEKRPN